MLRISISWTKSGGSTEEPPQSQSFSHNVTEILERNEHKGPMPPLLREFCTMVDNNTGYALSKVNSYKWMGLVLLTSIPIMSALLSALVSLRGIGWLPPAILGLSLALTIFTVVNSLYKPSARFHDACVVNMGIERFKSDFLIALVKGQKWADQDLASLVHEKQGGFDKYQHDLIGLFMPHQAATQPESPPQR